MCNQAVENREKINACKKKNANTRAKRVGVNLRRANVAEKRGLVQPGRAPNRSNGDPARRPGSSDGWTLGRTDRAAVTAVVSGAAAC